MKKKKNYNVIGNDRDIYGIDISYCFTDGLNKIKILNEKSYSYSISTQNFIKKIKIINFTNIKNTNKHDENITEFIISYLKIFLKEFNISKKKIDFISLSGQTILHLPEKKITLQFGNPTLISKYFKLNVVSDFRINDILNGGQGAPIGSYYHKLLINKINPKSAIINLGGVANFTLLNKNKLISSDIGPANAITDDLMFYFFKRKFDRNGTLASKGAKNIKIFDIYKKNTFF